MCPMKHVISENLSFWFLDVVIFQNQKHILTISKIYFKFGFCHFVGAFFLRKNFAVSQPDVGWFSKKKVDSSISISSYDYGSDGTLGAFFSVCRGNYPGKEKRGKMSKNQPDVAEFWYFFEILIY